MAGLYIHIPFCLSKCYYCDFYSHVGEPDFSLFLNVLKKELEVRKYYLNEELSTIYFGGGTPSLLTAGQLSEIFDTIYKHYKVDSSVEITLEANPDDLSDRYLKELKQLPINRLSIGAQTFDDSILMALRRRHDEDDIKRSVLKAQNIGFSNISLDIIYCLPNFTVKDLKAELRKIEELNIQHLSAYHLTIEKNTVFYTLLNKRIIKEVDEEESYAQYNTIIEWADRNNFIQYEVSNFGKIGRFSRHNSNYWRRVPYIGVGPSAHSYNGYIRRWNVSDLKEYLRFEELNGKIYQEEILSENDKFNDFILLSLRTSWGIDLDQLKSEFGHEKMQHVVSILKKYIETEHAVITDNIAKLTPEGLFISDKIISEIFIID